MNLETILLIVLLIGWIAIQIYFRYINDHQLNSIIDKHYENEGLKVVEISELKTSERLRYGVPINTYFRLFTVSFNLCRKLGNNHYRRIETTDKNQNEQVRYIDLYIKQRNLISCVEFDRYDF